MFKLNYFFRVKLAILLLRHSNSFSATLQNPKLSASQTQSITRETFIALEKLRDDDYLLFWKEILTESKQLYIDEPALVRKTKAPQQYKIVIAALRSVSFMKNSKVLLSKFTSMYWVYLLMQSKIGLSKRITNAEPKFCGWAWNRFSITCRQVKDNDFPSLLDVVKQMKRYEKAHVSQVIELFKLILV